MSLVKYEELIETLSKVGTTQREELLKLSIANLNEIYENDMKEVTKNIFTSFSSSLHDFGQRLCSLSKDGYETYIRLCSLLKKEPVSKEEFNRVAKKEEDMSFRGYLSLRLVFIGLKAFTNDQRYLLNLLMFGLILMLESGVEKDIVDSYYDEIAKAGNV